MIMIIGSVMITIYIHEAQSLKDKRSVMQSVLNRAKNRYNAAFAEVDAHDLWKKAVIGVVVLGRTTVHADQQIQNLISFFESEHRLEIAHVQVEFL